MGLFIINGANLLLAQAQPAPECGGLGAMLFPFALMFLLMYFLILRPQRRKEQERQAMLHSIKRDDHVLTSGGIYGSVQLIKDNEVVLKIDETNNVKVRVARSSIVGVEKSSEKSDK